MTEPNEQFPLKDFKEIKTDEEKEIITRIGNACKLIQECINMNSIHPLIAISAMVSILAKDLSRGADEGFDSCIKGLTAAYKAYKSLENQETP